MIKSSGKISATGAAVAAPCKFIGVTLVGDTAKEPTLTLYDDPDSAHGTVLAFLMVSDETHFASFMLPKPIRCANGIWGVLSAAEGDFIVYYEED